MHAAGTLSLSESYRWYLLGHLEDLMKGIHRDRSSPKLRLELTELLPCLERRLHLPNRAFPELFVLGAAVSTESQQGGHVREDVFQELIESVVGEADDKDGLLQLLVVEGFVEDLGGFHPNV